MGKPKVLLVEDDLFLRELYIEALSNEPYTVTVAEDGEIALQEMLKGGWDLVLLDVNLPKMNGNDILKKIKNEHVEFFPKKVIFLTNSEEARNSQELLALSQGFLIKTDLTPQEFVDKVKSYLQ